MTYLKTLLISAGTIALLAGSAHAQKGNADRGQRAERVVEATDTARDEIEGAAQNARGQSQRARGQRGRPDHAGQDDDIDDVEDDQDGEGHAYGRQRDNADRPRSQDRAEQARGRSADVRRDGERRTDGRARADEVRSGSENGGRDAERRTDGQVRSENAREDAGDRRDSVTEDAATPNTAAETKENGRRRGWFRRFFGGEK